MKIVYKSDWLCLVQARQTKEKEKTGKLRYYSERVFILQSAFNIESSAGWFFEFFDFYWSTDLLKQGLSAGHKC